jgi:hypothetical protein
MGSVRAVRDSEITAGPATEGMARKVAEGDQEYVGYVGSGPKVVNVDEAEPEG